MGVEKSAGEPILSLVNGLSVHRASREIAWASEPAKNAKEGGGDAAMTRHATLPFPYVGSSQDVIGRASQPHSRRLWWRLTSLTFAEIFSTR